jgi:hypothetical protein
MTPEPKMSMAAPYRWIGCVVLWPADVKDLLQALPPDARAGAALERTAQAAECLAGRLNEIEHGGAA